MITAAEFSSRSAWVSRSKPTPSDKNSRDMSSRSTEDSTRTVSPWNRESFATTESDFYSSLDLKDTELRGLEKEKEDPSEDALLVPILKCFPSLLSRRDRKRFRDWQTRPNPEDLVPRELLVSESFMESKELKEKRPPKDQLLWSRSMPSEELSRARRTLMPADTKLPRFRDWSLKSDWEERE